MGMVAMVLIGQLFLFGTGAAAQTETGQVRGVVSDPHGDAVSGAPVTVTSAATGAVREGTTTDVGSYTISNLQPEIYAVCVAAGTVDVLAGQLPGAGSYANAAATAAASALFGDFTPVSDYGPFLSSNTARNAFRRPGYWNLDPGLYKNLALGEGTLLQFRVELYKALNHANLFISDFDTDVAFLDYVPASYQGRRQVQLAIKLVF